MVATAIAATAPVIPAAMYIVVGDSSGAGDGDDVGDEMAVYKADFTSHCYSFEVFSFHGAKTDGCEAVRVFSRMRDAEKLLKS
jgi:hypothetical protein